MAHVVALLRGINVGGHQKVAMADLCGLCTSLAFQDVRSVLQSGNLVFRSVGRTAAQVERLLETEIRKRLGLHTEVFVRTAENWQSVLARNPFPDEAARDPSRMLVMFLKGAPVTGGVEALRAAITGREDVRADGREAYVVYPAGIGRSPVTNVLIERKLGTRATGRNWNTVLRIAAIAGA